MTYFRTPGLGTGQGVHTENLEVIAVWNKGIEVPGWNPAIYRKDAFGFWIAFSEYGDRNSQYGWEIDHIIAVALGGSDSLANKRPIHWRNNVRLGARVRTLLSD